MDRKKIEILQKCRKRKFLDNNDSENEGNSEQREQNAENDGYDDDFEEERDLINFELGKTQKGGICLWSEGGNSTAKNTRARESRTPNQTDTASGGGQPVQFGINSPAPSTLSWPSTVEQTSPLVQYSLSPSSTTILQPARPWEEPVVRRELFPIPFWNVHSHAASALARTNNGLEATHLHFSKGLCHHPALSDFISEVSGSIDRQVDAARSARNFIHKRHKRYVLQDAVIMRILADAKYDNDAEIHDAMTALGLQVEGYAGKLKDYENMEDSSMDVA